MLKGCKQPPETGERDVLVLYTDGITEAQKEQGAFLAKDRLLDSVRSTQGLELKTFGMP